jgi:hypothetical protein
MDAIAMSKIKKVESQLSDIMNKLNTATDLIFEVGGITNGFNTDSPIRLRSSNFIKVSAGDTINIVDDSFSFNVWMYTLENVNSFTVTPNIWIKTYTFTTDAYIRVTLRLDTNSTDVTNYVNSKLINLIKIIKTVDLVLFMGQSNMAGRGVAAEAPIVPTGQGYEFRAISDPTKLYNIVEPFGVNENNASGINEPGMKTGSMVSAFAIEYYKDTKIPVVGVSASKGGSSITEWQPGGTYLNDAITRYKTAKNWLLANGYIIRNKYIVWLQGETDGDNSMSKVDYTTYIKAMIDEMVNNQGIKKCFIIRIGNQRDVPTQYDNIISAQTDLCKTYSKAVMISCRLASYATAGLMKDTLHFLQSAYNEFGTEAGLNAAYFINTGKEPTMYDSEYSNLYVSQKF